jgi:hypothetical protein
MSGLAPNKDRDVSATFQGRRRRARTFFTLFLAFSAPSIYFASLGWEEILGFSGLTWSGVFFVAAILSGFIAALTYRCPACGTMPSTFSFDGMGADANPDHCAGCGAQLR